MAHIYKTPDTVNFSLPYDDNSGKRIEVKYEKDRADIKIETIDYILVDKNDIDWLIDVLRDIRELSKSK